MKDCCKLLCKRIPKYVCQGAKGKKLFTCEVHLSDSVEELIGKELMVIKIDYYS